MITRSCIAIQFLLSVEKVSTFSFVRCFLRSFASICFFCMCVLYILAIFLIWYNQLEHLALGTAPMMISRSTIHSCSEWASTDYRTIFVCCLHIQPINIHIEIVFSNTRTWCAHMRMSENRMSDGENSNWSVSRWLAETKGSPSNERWQIELNRMKL